MRSLRKWVLVLSLAAAVTAGAARRAPIPDFSERAPSTFEEVVTVFLDFFVLYNRLSFPPG
jgi:hypothetical protein